MEKIIDIEERIPTLRERRRKRTNRRFVMLLVIFLVSLLTLLYFQSSYSHISKVNVVGAKLVDQDTYVDLSGLSEGDSLWGFQSSKVERNIQNNDWVKEVSVHRKWFNKVTIQVKEWGKVGYLEQDKAYHVMLENGAILQTNVSLSNIDAPILKGFEDKEARKLMAKELGKLKKEIVLLISQVNSVPTETNPLAIKLFMNDGFEVRANVSSLADKLNYYPSIVSQINSEEKGIIDIEVGSYFRTFKDEYGSTKGEVGANEGQAAE